MPTRDSHVFGRRNVQGRDSSGSYTRGAGRSTCLTSMYASGISSSLYGSSVPHRFVSSFEVFIELEVSAFQ